MNRKTLVHASFWGAQILILSAFFPINDPLILNIAFLGGMLSFFTYIIAIGLYASELNRSGIIWGGLSLLFSPIGPWVSYIVSFFGKQLPPKPSSEP